LDVTCNKIGGGGESTLAKDQRRNPSAMLPKIGWCLNSLPPQQINSFHDSKAFKFLATL